MINLLYLNKEELMNLGFTELESDNIDLVTTCAIKKIAPYDIQKDIQERSVECQVLPPPWRQVEVHEKKAYFNASSLEFQTKEPGITADEIEQYNAI